MLLLCFIILKHSVRQKDNFKSKCFIFQKFKLIDTAGIRRRAAVASSGSTTEALSVNRAFRAVRRSDVVALVIEAMACITEQVFVYTYYLLNMFVEHSRKGSMWKSNQNKD